MMRMPTDNTCSRHGGMLLLLFLLLMPAALPASKSDAEESLRLVIRSERKSTCTPVFWKVADTGISVQTKWYSLKLTSTSGTELPVQLDDINANGRLDGQDEIAALVDLLPGENTFSLSYTPVDLPASEQIATVQFTVMNRDGNVSIDNGLVKFDLYQWQVAQAKQSILAADDKGKWTGIATQYYDEPKFDNQFGGYKTVRNEVKVMGGGPVRVIIRQLSEMKNEAAGKSVEMAREWQIFKGRREILSRREYRNTTPDQALVFTQLNSGYYHVTPGGRFDYHQDRFAGLDKGTLRSDIFKNGNFTVKAEKNGPVWYDVSCAAEGKPDIGLGSFIEGGPRPGNIFLGDIGQNDQHRLRMTEYYYPLPNPTLWPGKTYTFTRWYVVHSGNYQAVKDFAELRHGLTYLPSAN